MERTLLYAPKVKVQMTPFKIAKDAIAELEFLIGDKEV